MSASSLDVLDLQRLKLHRVVFTWDFTRITSQRSSGFKGCSDGQSGQNSYWWPEWQMGGRSRNARADLQSLQRPKISHESFRKLFAKIWPRKVFVSAPQCPPIHAVFPPCTPPLPRRTSTVTNAVLTTGIPPTN